ncbi:uncharacterized protein Bfra_009463 [Botrytis fragariae]|uniref:Fungal N-terminal domain-containing protein n=1 Tax=Botrytis fragariae TaxID=1964551 RepID=A0A8H6ANA6_9HELO|nr:uncharacterized protein Bfra_009463 [Botrytis fragariae]KAF5870908.1 hypothetical protein Bfra_009463 [Botrytis fragariae]
MAEVLGTVASGIGVAQLAGNLASSIIKLKGYWDQVQDAPDDIGFLVREIDAHHLILRSILESQAKIASSGRPSNTFLENSLKLCEDSLNELNELVKVLGKEINSSNKWRSKLGATKVVLKNDQLKRLKKRMKNASRLMNLAITWQTNATLQEQFPILELKMQTSLDRFLINYQKLIPAPPMSYPTIQISSMDALVPPSNVATITQPQNSKRDSNSTPRFVPEDCTSAQMSSRIYSLNWSLYLMGSIDIRKTQQKLERNRFEETEAKYKPPAWLSNRAWQCMYTKDLSTLRWNVNIQTYRTLDTKSIFYNALRKGDVVGVQEMLANRTAFVNDQFVARPVTGSWDNGSPLHIAASHNHLDLCKLLLAKGADVSSEGALFGKTPLSAFVFTTRHNHIYRSQAFDHTHALDILRTLVEAGADSELIDQTDVLAISASGPEELFHYIQQHTYMSSGEINFIDKLDIALRFMSSESVQSQNLMLSYLEDPNFQAKIALHRDNVVVEKFFVTICREYSQDGFKDNGVDLIKKMMSAGISLHTLDHNGETILQREFRDCRRRLGVHEKRSCSFKMWLGFLIDLGVDLNTYGKVESSIYHKRRLTRDLDAPQTWLLVHVLGFKYGPRIEDWELLFYERTDEYAGDFWKLIENPLQAALANLSIPGEWVD